MGVVLPSAGVKLRTTKISSEGLDCKSVKFCTSKNFPLYSIGPNTTYVFAFVKSVTTASADVAGNFGRELNWWFGNNIFTIYFLYMPKLIVPHSQIKIHQCQYASNVSKLPNLIPPILSATFSWAAWHPYSMQHWKAGNELEDKAMHANLMISKQVHWPRNIKTCETKPESSYWLW